MVELHCLLLLDLLVWQFLVNWLFLLVQIRLPIWIGLRVYLFNNLLLLHIIVLSYLVILCIWQLCNSNIYSLSIHIILKVWYDRISVYMNSLILLDSLLIILILWSLQLVALNFLWLGGIPLVLTLID